MDPTRAVLDPHPRGLWEDPLLPVPYIVALCLLLHEKGGHNPEGRQEEVSLSLADSLLTSSLPPHRCQPRSGGLGLGCPGLWDPGGSPGQTQGKGGVAAVPVSTMDRAAAFP